MSEASISKDARYDALIQGAGIGGLTLAIALQQRGYAVKVVERAAGLSEVGAGIWMAANPMQVFARLGVAEAVMNSGWTVKTLRLQDSTSGDLRVTDLSEIAQRYGFETVAIHRAVLQRVLFEQLKQGTVQFGCEVHSVAQTGEQVVATLTDGCVCEASVLAGADGLHSQVRLLAGLGGEKRYSGYSSYRGIARDACVLPSEADHDAYEIWAKGCRVGFSKVNARDYYWYMTFVTPMGESATPEQRRAHAEAMLRKHFPKWIGLLQVTRTEEILRTDISDLKPLPKWSSGRIGLLGDAAHATTPNLGQGGAMAVEDALTLTNAFEQCGLNEAAWRRYEQQRRKKVEWTVSTSASIGKICHIGNPLFRALRNSALRRTPASVTQKQIERIYSLQD